MMMMSKLPTMARGGPVRTKLPHRPMRGCYSVKNWLLPVRVSLLVKRFAYLISLMWEICKQIANMSGSIPYHTSRICEIMLKLCIVAGRLFFLHALSRIIKSRQSYLLVSWLVCQSNSRSSHLAPSRKVHTHTHIHTGHCGNQWDFIATVCKECAVMSVKYPIQLRR